MSLFARAFRLFLPAALALTAAVGTTYVAVQQVYRNLADDPQIQLAEDAAARLDAGASPEQVVGADRVDAAKSLAPFVVVYSADGTVLASSGVLDGRAPTPPSGVLDRARDNGRNRVTLQPRPSVRIASVSVAAADGRVVLAGRSLRETEKRVGSLGMIAGGAWLAGLLGIACSVLFATLFPEDSAEVRAGAVADAG